ncbi:hypothetical protein [Pseudonocardia sp.]|uniref:hypothetical protein n=1 Tax=Pseudonocardia sp. TaxID=60912 RepID=UPI002607D742|nr:hypothetical protein [Pseudonocardia sp.]
MERGSDKHGSRTDDALASQLAGQLGGPGGSNREEWADPEPPADDDHEPPPAPGVGAGGGPVVDDDGEQR